MKAINITKMFFSVKAPENGKFVYSPGFLNKPLIRGLRVLDDNTGIKVLYPDKQSFTIYTKTEAVRIALFESILSILKSNVGDPHQYDGAGFISRPVSAMVDIKCYNNQNKEFPPLTSEDMAQYDILDLNKIILIKDEYQANFGIFNLIFELSDRTTVKWLFNSEEDFNDSWNLLNPYLVVNSRVEDQKEIEAIHAKNKEKEK